MSNSAGESASMSPIRSLERLHEPIYSKQARLSPRTDVNNSLEANKGLGLNSGKLMNQD